MPMEKILHEKPFITSILVEVDQIEKDVTTPSSFMASLNTPFEASASVTAATSPPRQFSFFECFSTNNKRVSEDQTKNEDYSCVDPRHKRMMKNRESAARSRARRQAYTSELEREIAELKEENARLRKHQVELLLSAPVPVGIPKKNTHNRSMTAPF